MSKIKKLKNLLTTLNLDAFIVPSDDEFGITVSSGNRLNYLTGFTGSHGVAIITTDYNIFFTDSRYLLQAQKELGKDFLILNINSQFSCGCFSYVLPPKANIGYDPKLHTYNNIKYYLKLADQYNFIMKPIEENLVDKIWPDKPRSLASDMQILPLDIVGMSVEDKIQQIASNMHKDATHLLITNPDAICWLLNIRGNDAPFVPLVKCYAILSKEGEVDLFVKLKSTKKINQVKIHQLKSLEANLEELLQKKKVAIQADPNQTPIKFIANNKKIIFQPSPIDSIKACKNETELSGIRHIQELDSLAVTRFLYNIHTTTAKVTELDAVRLMLSLRKRAKSFLGPSFETISAYGPNASIIHYHTNKETNTIIGKDNFYLIDSGGQYTHGTTDITRTIHLGEPSLEQKHYFTLVLKCHINLARCVFPQNTHGVHLDVLARYALWQHGLDYGHSPSHGIGYRLNVHEAPPSISKRIKDSTLLKESMILSNEPGYYEDGKFGIRTENIMTIIKSKKTGFLEFETLSLVPIQGSLIEANMLTTDEKQWLDNYHHNVINILGLDLSEEEINWLHNYVKIKN